MIPTALRWRTQSIPTIPLHPNSKRPCIPWRRYQTSLPSVSNLITWFSRPANLAVITGGPRNLVILDYDDPNAHPDLPKTYAIKTSRGFHYYFFTDTPTSTMIADGVEVKGNRAYCCAPPSVHPSGAAYAVMMDAPIAHVSGVADIVDIEVSLPHTPTEHLPSPVQDTPATLIQWIKVKLPILLLLSRYTCPIPSSPDGRWYVMRCPHPDHHDRNPSFWADSHRGLCACYTPRCKASQPGGKVMDVINLFAWLEECGNRDAIKELTKQV